MQFLMETIFAEVWKGTSIALRIARQLGAGKCYIENAVLSNSREHVLKQVNRSLVNPNLVNRKLGFDKGNVAVRGESRSFRWVSYVQWK